jgi:hypothetical protein
MRIKKAPNHRLIATFEIDLNGGATNNRLTIFSISKVHLYSVLALIGLGLTTLLKRPSQLHVIGPETTLLYVAHTNTDVELKKKPLYVDNTNANSFPTPDIVLEWRDWTELEYTVNSIWGGSRFCRIIKEHTDQYYRDVRAKVLLQQQQEHPPVTGEQQSTELPLPIPTISILYEISCYDLYKLSEHGTGNYIQVIYFMRMAVKFMPNVKIRLNVTCIENDSPEFYTNYVLPWFTGVWYTPSETERLQHIADIQRYNSSITDIGDERYCGHYKLNPIAVMYKEMQYDVRRMAVALVGSQPFINDDDRNNESRNEITGEIKKFLNENIYEPERAVSLRYTRIQSTQNISLKPGTIQGRFNTKTTNIVPLLQLQQSNNKNIIFDDAVIHFRCGDLLITDLAYGFLTFHGYSRHISSSVRSIGILTQPFGKVKKSTVGEEQQSSIADQGRTMDTKNEVVARRCLTLVYAFKQYLEEKFPNATVEIRNDRTETVALAYARMVMAKQVVGSMSTFSIYPVIGSFGTGYYMRPKSMEEPSCWAENDMFPISIIQDLRTVIFDENNTLEGRDVRELWNGRGDDVILKWFRNDGDM